MNRTELKMLKPLSQPAVNNDYENFRWFFTSENTLVVGGKSDEQNEAALKKFLKPNYTVMHTSEPGSPFMIIQSDNPTKKDIEETAVFTACFSQQWKQNRAKKSVEIDVFKGEQIFKINSMKTGTFGVRGRKEVMKAELVLGLVVQRGKIRAVPLSKKENPLAEIRPGRLSKEEAAEKIAKKIKDKYDFPVSKEEIMQAIPSDKIEIK